MPKSDYLKNEILDHMLSGAVFASPATVYVALYTVAPTDAGGGTEVSAASYARVAVTNNAVNFPAAVAGAKTLATQLDFPQATENWGTVEAIGILDAAAAGNLLFWANVNVAQAVTTGDIARFPASSITFTEA